VRLAPRSRVRCARSAASHVLQRRRRAAGETATATLTGMTHGQRLFTGDQVVAAQPGATPPADRDRNLDGGLAVEAVHAVSGE
jgi:hypothetical protein